MFPELMPCAQETSRKLLADRKFLKIKNGRQETSQETSSDRAFVYPVFRARDSVAVLCMPRFARVWTRLFPVEFHMCVREMRRHDNH